LKHVPQLIIVESKIVNAMTVSPEEVIVTTGLLKKLDLRETCAVLGHELGHAVSDHKTPRIAATVVFGGGGAIAAHRLLDRFEKINPSRLSGVFYEMMAYILGGTAGSMVANQISVKPTELQADLKGAAISGDPQGLISALNKLEAGRKPNPIKKMFSYLHSGYPTTEQRIHNLQKIAAQMPAPVLSAPISVMPVTPHVSSAQPSPTVSSIAADARVDGPMERIALS
jgi:Zn-dependent protease with chaperone function